MGIAKYSPPQRISAESIVENFGERPRVADRRKGTREFDCGEISLNDWLIKRALKNDQGDASRTYVVCCENIVIAYYSLHLGCIQHSEAVRKIKRNMPDPIPAIVLGRLAVDELHQGKGLARALIKDLFLRAIQVSDLAGTKAVLVKALNDKIIVFYQSFGFVQSKTDPLLLMKAIAEVRASIKDI